MQMRRTITSAFLALALLLLPLTDRAQQSSPAKPQGSSPVIKSQASSLAAKPQAPAPAQSAAPKQEPVQKSDQTIKTVVNLVDVLFTVLNRRNKLVPELEKGDFKIWDDKAPQEIRNLEVALFELGDEFVAAVEHSEKHVDEVDHRLDRLIALLDRFLLRRR